MIKVVFSSTFFGFHRDVTCYHIVVQEGDAIFLPSQWIHFVHTPVDSIAYACNFIMETHLHVSALAFKKELDAGLSRRFLFPNFPGLIVMQLHMEWANKNRSSPITKAAMREMLQIIKADERRTARVDSTLDKPWAEFLYRYAATVSDLHWDVLEEWLRR